MKKSFFSFSFLLAVLLSGITPFETAWTSVRWMLLDYLTAPGPDDDCAPIVRGTDQGAHLFSVCFAADAPPPVKKKKASVIIENNQMYQNVLAGIRIKGTTPITISSCNVFENGRGGADIGKEADVRIIDTDFYRNRRGGINIEDINSVYVQNSRIHNNLRGGMRIQAKIDSAVTVITMKDNRIYHNENAGIRCQPVPGAEVDLRVKGNQIFENTDAGIRLENKTVLTVEENVIHHNGTAGIIAHDSTVPAVVDIFHNTISFNDGPGIHLYTAVSGPIGIRNNWIYANKRSGVICGFRETLLSTFMDVEIANNTIVGNGSEKQGAGIRNDSNGKVTMINNILAYNYVTGIRTASCEDYSYNLTFANGKVRNCCDDPYKAPFYVEKEQYAGCSGRGKGDLISDPMFVDPDNYNFHIHKRSPARRSGKKIFDPATNELSDNNDMGASGGPYAIKEETGQSSAAKVTLK